MKFPLYLVQIWLKKSFNIFTGKAEGAENLFVVKDYILERISEVSAGLIKKHCCLGSFMYCGKSVLASINFFSIVL